MIFSQDKVNRLLFQIREKDDKIPLSFRVLELITDEYGIGCARQPCGRFFQFFPVARFGGHARHEMLHMHEEVESRADFVYVAVFHGKLIQPDADGNRLFPSRFLMATVRQTGRAIGHELVRLLVR